MLKFGELVAVNKDLYNKDSQLYNAWLQLDLETKDGNGNYVMNTFHQNYYQKNPFDIQKDLQRLDRFIPVLSKKSALEKFGKKLKKAFLVAAYGTIGDKHIPVLLSVNPKEGLIDVFDRQMNLIDLTPVFEQHQNKPDSEETQSRNKGLKP